MVKDLSHWVGIYVVYNRSIQTPNAGSSLLFLLRLVSKITNKTGLGEDAEDGAS